MRRPTSLGEATERLLSWYDREKRPLPWRATRDPYAIWVSEIMCQQTQIASVLPFYERWMTRFPTVEALAAADEDAVLTLWQGLGYYRRARQLLAGARRVAAEGFPTTAAGWRKVEGVGPYTAGAIASIALNEPAPLVDGNVVRVYARLAGHDSVGAALQRHAWDWAAQHVHPDRPGDWNQALMELGATVCKPVAPRCDVCPIANVCIARQTWRVDELPRSAPRPETRRQTHLLWIPTYRGTLGVRQIPPGQWWEGMWEFPRAVTDNPDDEPTELRTCVGPGWVKHLGTIRHVVTRHQITLHVSTLEVEAPSPELRWCTEAQLQELAMPQPQRRAMRLLAQS